MTACFAPEYGDTQRTGGTRITRQARPTMAFSASLAAKRAHAWAEKLTDEDVANIIATLRAASTVNASTVILNLLTDYAKEAGETPSAWAAQHLGDRTLPARLKRGSVPRTATLNRLFAALRPQAGARGAAGASAEE